VRQARQATIEFSLKWNSGRAAHADRLLIPEIDFRRDSFPGSMEQKLPQMQSGEQVEETFSPGELVEPWKPSDLRKIPLGTFNSHYNNLRLTPHMGRFYPVALIAGATGHDHGDMRPFRVVEVGDETLTVDLNHPLSQYPLTVRATLLEPFTGTEQRGGGCQDIAVMLTQKGPGMQARNGEGPAYDFPLARADDKEDSLFYAMPRMVDHIDRKAVEILKSIHARYVKPGSRVLDLMTSWTSHLDMAGGEVAITGIGMNQQELDANPLLNDRLLQDLNKTPLLPFDDDSFDVVLCSLSVEYLISPRAVFAEVRRVLKPGGLFLNSFSERWFPTKAVTLWTEMHPFERIGMVLDHYIATRFDDLQTESVRGHFRPDDDKYRGMSPFSDPLYVVAGRKS
jgi:hypothetical protein